MKYLILLLFIALGISVSAQDTFSLYYPNPYYANGGARGSSVHVANDTIYVVFGTIVDTDLMGTGYILKYDLQGNALDSIELDSQNSNLNVNLGRYGGNILQDDGFVMPMTEFLNYAPESNVNSLVKISLNGDVIWKKNISINPNRRHLYRKVIPFHDGYAVIGDISDSLTNNDFDERSGLLTVTDSIGNVLWHQEYDDMHDLYFVAPAAGGGLILCGDKHNYIGQNPVDTKVVRVDSSGEMVWQYIFGDEGGEGKSPVIQAMDGSYLVFSMDDDLPNFNFGSGPFWIKRFADDSIVNPTWGFYVTQDVKNDWNNTDKIIRNALELQDSSIIMVGANGTEWPELDNAFIGKIDKDLNPIWSRYYTFTPGAWSAYYVFNDVELMPDNGFVATGYVIRQFDDPNFPSGLEQMILFRFDSYGCLEPGCQFTGIEEINIGLENTMILFPNPIISGNPLHLKFTEQVGYTMPYANVDTKLIIYDITGRQVLQKDVPRRGSNDSFDMTLEVPPLSPGQYTLQWVGEAWYDAVGFVVGH